MISVATLANYFDYAMWALVIVPLLLRFKYLKHDPLKAAIIELALDAVASAGFFIFALMSTTWYRPLLGVLFLGLTVFKIIQLFKALDKERFGV
ncbi:MAG: hypothetical protein ABL940_11840 [Bacteroidia bacterium]|jgi:hypothetical protein